MIAHSSEVAARPVAVQPPASIGATPPCATRRKVEVILGFRPGKDRLPLTAGQRIDLKQEAGDVVIDRGADGIIVLQGVSLLDLVAGVEAAA